MDLIIRKDRPFCEAEFQRRVPATLLGVEVFGVTAEDTIFAKPEWVKAGSSDRQLRDIKGILKAQSGQLDVAHIETWAKVLGFHETWNRLSQRRSFSKRRLVQRSLSSIEFVGQRLSLASIQKCQSFRVDQLTISGF